MMDGEWYGLFFFGKDLTMWQKRIVCQSGRSSARKGYRSANVVLLSLDPYGVLETKEAVQLSQSIFILSFVY